MRDLIGPACTQVMNQLGTHAWNAPFLLYPKLRPLFLTSCHTVSYEILSSNFNCTNRSANSCDVQRFRPSGGLLWAKVSRMASPFSSIFFYPSGRGRSLRAPSRLPFTNRWRVRCTVAVPICRASAISPSALPSSASSRIRARLSSRAECLPLLMNSSRAECSLSKSL